MMSWMYLMSSSTRALWDSHSVRDSTPVDSARMRVGPKTTPRLWGFILFSLSCAATSLRKATMRPRMRRLFSGSVAMRFWQLRRTASALRSP